MGRRKPPQGDGFLVVDKPAGITSHDAVAIARRAFGEKRNGYSGTLDPDATGLLLMGVGRATKLLPLLLDLRKKYVGEIVFGTSTSTLDSKGDVTGTFEMGHIRLVDVAREAAKLTGRIMQIPPMVSAIKVDGVRLHAMAREGIEIERQPRAVSVYKFEVAESSDPLVFRCEVECSSGTYIRSLANDVGAGLGGGAHLRNLRRTQIGSFRVESASQVTDLALLPMIDALVDYCAAVVPPELVDRVRRGTVLERDVMQFVGPGPWPVVTVDGELLGVYQAHHGSTVKPTVILPPATQGNVR